MLVLSFVKPRAGSAVRFAGLDGAAGRVDATGLTAWLGWVFGTAFPFRLDAVGLLGSVLVLGKFGLAKLGLLAAYGLAVAGLYGRVVGIAPLFGRLYPLALL